MGAAEECYGGILMGANLDVRQVGAVSFSISGEAFVVKLRWSLFQQEMSHQLV